MRFVLVVMVLVVLCTVAIAAGDYAGIIDATPIVEQLSATTYPRIRSW